MRNGKTRTVTAGLMLILAATAVRADEIRLADVGTDAIVQDYGSPQTDKSCDGHPLMISAHAFEHGVGTHAESVWKIDLHGTARRFVALVGVDDEVLAEVKTHGEHTRDGMVMVSITGDHKSLFNSKRIKAGDPAVPIDIDVSGVKTLTLDIRPAGNANTDDHADWVDATIQYTGDKPGAETIPPEREEILTPPAPAEPRINGAAVVGVRPTHPLLYTIAATGDRPMTYTADGLPAGLSLDANSGRITGVVASPTTADVHVTATNAKGSAQRDLKIIVGDRIALTPPMGWNSWNCFAGSVSQEKVQAAADAMVNSGLIQHGWTYINVDDCWEVRADEPKDALRNADGSIKTNAKFPDMHEMADYIHDKGLRAGLYSSPGPSTCGGFTASYQFENKDAQSYANWGFDYLKYDWCSYGGVAAKIKKQPNPPTELEVDQQPYRVMQAALAKQNRDILYSLCQYGMGDVWKWGDEVGGNCWRTTGDIVDNWRSMSGIGFKQTADAPYAKPGCWNDPDMLVVGKVGWGKNLHATKLTPNEQYTHISLWSLLSAPLLIGCDMTQMDDFTKSLLTNDEVLAIDQDPLGKSATPVVRNADETEVWSKPLSDGSHAVGLFNRGDEPIEVAVKWSDLGITGSHKIRDLWRQKDLGASSDSFKASVARHGVILVKIN